MYAGTRYKGRMMLVGRDPILGDNDSAWFLPWLLAVVVYLGTLATVGIVIVDTALTGWKSMAYSSAIVELPPVTTPELVDHAVEQLRQTVGVENVRIVSRDEISSLLEPWLPSTDLLDQLPIPWLIDVEIKKGVSPDWEDLEKSLAGQVPGVSLNSGVNWFENVAKPLRIVQGTAILILILVVGATIAAVSLTARAALAIHRDTIELVHLLGASDEYIVKQFQRRVIGMAVKGGAMGAVLATVTLYVVEYVGGHIDNSLIPKYDLNVGCWIAMCATPCAAVLIAVFTVRRIVVRAVIRML